MCMTSALNKTRKENYKSNVSLGYILGSCLKHPYTKQMNKQYWKANSWGQENGSIVKEVVMEA